MAYVREEDYKQEEQRADRAFEKLRRFKEENKRALHKTGHVMTACATAAAIGIGESYVGSDLEFLGMPAEAIVATVALTAGAAGVGGDVGSEYIGAAGTGAACVVSYKWGKGNEAVSGDGEIGARTRRPNGGRPGNARATPPRMAPGARAALPPGLDRAAERGGYSPDREAKLALRRLGLAA